MGRIFALLGPEGGKSPPPDDCSLMAVSDDNGLTWQTSQIPLGTKEWRAIGWNGSTLCIIGYGCDYAALSPDGLTNWTLGNLPLVGEGSMHDDFWNVITWSGSVFCIITESSSSGGVATSPDGITWTDGYIPAHGGCGLASSGTNFVTLDSGNDTSYSQVSTDGLTWTMYDHTFPFPGPLWNKLLWNGTKYCALTVDGNYAAVSADGLNWNTATYGIYAGPSDNTACNATTFCSLWNNTSLVSTDGLNWTTYPLLLSASGWKITWNGSVFCAADIAGRVITSPDGINWTQRTTLPRGAVELHSDWRIPGIYYNPGSFTTTSTTTTVAPTSTTTTGLPTTTTTTAAPLATLGQTTLTSTASFGKDTKWVYKITTDISGFAATTISVGIDAASGDPLRLFIFPDNGGLPYGTTVLAVTETTPAMGFTGNHSASFNLQLEPNTSYWIGLQLSHAETIYYQYAAGSTITVPDPYNNGLDNAWTGASAVAQKPSVWISGVATTATTTATPTTTTTTTTVAPTTTTTTTTSTTTTSTTGAPTTTTTRAPTTTSTTTTSTTPAPPSGPPIVFYSKFGRIRLANYFTGALHYKNSYQAVIRSRLNNITGSSIIRVTGTRIGKKAIE